MAPDPTASKCRKRSLYRDARPSLHRHEVLTGDEMSTLQMCSLGFTVLSGVLKMTNEVTLGEFWCLSTTVSD